MRPPNQSRSVRWKLVSWLLNPPAALESTSKVRACPRCMLAMTSLEAFCTSAAPSRTAIESLPAAAISNSSAEFAAGAIRSVPANIVRPPVAMLEPLSSRVRSPETCARDSGSRTSSESPTRRTHRTPMVSTWSPSKRLELSKIAEPFTRNWPVDCTVPTQGIAAAQRAAQPIAAHTIMCLPMTISRPRQLDLEYTQVVDWSMDMA